MCPSPIVSPCSLLLVFFQSDADPRGLHSFPTRRSSDLTSGRDMRSAPMVAIVSTSASMSAGGRPTSMRWSTRSRSEEHTSELQSLRHLVCRLLLEKKNKQNYNVLT